MTMTWTIRRRKSLKTKIFPCYTRRCFGVREMCWDSPCVVYGRKLHHLWRYLWGNESIHWANAHKKHEHLPLQFTPRLVTQLVRNVIKLPLKLAITSSHLLIRSRRSVKLEALVFMIGSISTSNKVSHLFLSTATSTNVNLLNFVHVLCIIIPGFSLRPIHLPPFTIHRRISNYQ